MLLGTCSVSWLRTEFVIIHVRVLLSIRHAMSMQHIVLTYSVHYALPTSSRLQAGSCTARGRCF